MAINSEFVGFPREFCIVYPKYELKTSTSPLSHATSIAWRMARSTLEEVVEKVDRNNYMEVEYTEEELEEIENQEAEDAPTYDDDIDYDEYEDFYDEDDN